MNTTDAKSVAGFVGVDRVVGGVPVSLSVPGHDGRHYKVELERDRVLSYWCDCKGASHSVCYHGLAAAIKAATEKGYTLTWTQNKANAQRLANLGGRVISLTSSRSKVRAWGVLRGEVSPIQVAVVPRRRQRLTPHPNKLNLIILFSTAYGDVTIGDNYHSDVSKPSWKRLNRLLKKWYGEGRAQIGWMQSGYGYQIVRDVS